MTHAAGGASFGGGGGIEADHCFVLHVHVPFEVVDSGICELAVGLVVAKVCS